MFIGKAGLGSTGTGFVVVEIVACAVSVAAKRASENSEIISFIFRFLGVINLLNFYANTIPKTKKPP